MEAKSADIKAVYMEKRVFDPTKEFVEKARLKSMDEPDKYCKGVQQEKFASLKYHYHSATATSATSLLHYQTKAPIQTHLLLYLSELMYIVQTTINTLCIRLANMN